MGKGVMGMDDGLSDLSRLAGWLGVAHDRFAQKLSAMQICSILASLSNQLTPAL